MSEGLRRNEQQVAELFEKRAQEQQVADQQKAFEEEQERQRAEFAEFQAQQELARQEAQRQRDEQMHTETLTQKDAQEQAEREHREQVARRLAGANLPTTEGGHRTPNDEAEVRIYGERTTMEPQRDSYSGQTVMVEVNKRGPGKREEILAGKKYGDTPAKREALANRYMKDIETFVDSGLELSQAEMIANRGLQTPTRINEIAAKMLANGSERGPAFKKATALVEAANKKFADTIRREGIVTEEQYEQYKDGTLNNKKEEEPIKPEPQEPKGPETSPKGPEGDEPKGPEGGDDGGDGTQPAGPQMPQGLPGPGKAGVNAPPLLERGPNVPLPDPHRNSNAVVRWLRGHPSGKITNAMKYALGGLKREPREDREKVLAVLRDDKSTLNEKLQGLDEAGAKQTKLLLERAALAGRDLSADLENAKSLREVKKIIKDAQPTGGDAVQARMARADTLTTGEGDNRRRRFEAQGDNTVSPEDSRAQIRNIRAASFDTLQQWSEDEGVMGMLSPAAVSALQMRLSQRGRVEAAAAANGGQQPEPQQPRRRLFGRRNRGAEQTDAGLDILDTQRKPIDLAELRSLEGQDQADRLRILHTVRAGGNPALVRRVAEDIGEANLSQESRDLLDRINREEAGTN